MIKKESLHGWWKEIGQRYKKQDLIVRVDEENGKITLLLPFGNHTMLVGRYDTTKDYGYVLDRRSSIRENDTK